MLMKRDAYEMNKVKCVLSLETNVYININVLVRTQDRPYSKKLIFMFELRMMLWQAKLEFIYSL